MRTGKEDIKERTSQLLHELTNQNKRHIFLNKKKWDVESDDLIRLALSYDTLQFLIYQIKEGLLVHIENEATPGAPLVISREI
jgi:hypothetical protein